MSVNWMLLAGNWPHIECGGAEIDGSAKTGARAKKKRTRRNMVYGEIFHTYHVWDVALAKRSVWNDLARWHCSELAAQCKNMSLCSNRNVFETRLSTFIILCHRVTCGCRFKDRVRIGHRKRTAKSCVVVVKYCRWPRVTFESYLSCTVTILLKSENLRYN